MTPKQLLLGGEFLTWLKPEYTNAHRYQAEANYALKNYKPALAEMNEAIKLQRANDAARAADGVVTPAMASLLLLRGRVLEAQRSPEARKDFQQVVNALTRAGSDNETKAFAQLHLGKFDPKYFTEAERFFTDQTTKDPDHSLTYYNRACFFAVRSASPGRDKNARAKDVTAAIDALRKGANLPKHDSLQRFVDTKAELLTLKNDPRFIKLLKEEEASASGDSSRSRAFPKKNRAEVNRSACRLGRSKLQTVLCSWDSNDEKIYCPRRHNFKKTELQDRIFLEQRFHTDGSHLGRFRLHEVTRIRSRDRGAHQWRFRLEQLHQF